MSRVFEPAFFGGDNAARKSGSIIRIGDPTVFSLEAHHSNQERIGERLWFVGGLSLLGTAVGATSTLLD